MVAIIPWGSGATATYSPPSTNLLAQFDASDTANYNAGTGVWTPTAGSAGINLQYQTTGGSTGGFSLSGTAQNGYLPINVPTAYEFRPVSTSGGTVTEITITVAYRVNTYAGGQLFNFVRSGGSVTMGLYVDSTSLAQLNYTDVGNPVTATLTDLNSGDGSFRIASMMYDAGTTGLILFNREGTTSTVGSMASYTNAVYPMHTSASWAEAGDLDVCEVLVHGTPNPGTMVAAIVYLQQKWSET